MPIVPSRPSELLLRGGPKLRGARESRLGWPSLAEDRDQSVRQSRSGFPA